MGEEEKVGSEREEGGGRWTGGRWVRRRWCAVGVEEEVGGGQVGSG